MISAKCAILLIVFVSTRIGEAASHFDGLLEDHAMNAGDLSTAWKPSGPI
jgi:hypothetical protein